MMAPVAMLAFTIPPEGGVIVTVAPPCEKKASAAILLSLKRGKGELVLNKVSRPCVQYCVRKFVGAMIGFNLVLVSCSSFRMVDGDQVAAPGVQVSRTVLRSNVLVKKGSHLAVAYSSGNRFYVSKGGVLSGFHRGARDTTIFSETGAHLPERKFLSRIKVVKVDNAERAYQQRFRELPPLKKLLGGGSWSDEDVDYEYDDYEYDRGIRAVSVSPDSYRKKD
ncbi:MAG: hypothetical protein CMO60_04710 [Verrucomicrobiales bacterium]|nr:hypothetical protein [Verrucomicrobiales bacterium]